MPTEKEFLKWSGVREVWGKLKQKWSEVSKCFTIWKDTNEKWGDLEQTWNDVGIICKAEEIITNSGGGDPYFFFPPEPKYKPPVERLKEKLPPKEYERFVELACKVNDITYKQLLKRKNKNKPVITIKEIEKTILAVKINVKVTNISLSQRDI